MTAEQLAAKIVDDFFAALDARFGANADAALLAYLATEA